MPVFPFTPTPGKEQIAKTAILSDSGKLSATLPEIDGLALIRDSGAHGCPK
jgi:hypothetical protein